MKERPILFNAEMVRAVLDGSKTQTRRIVKPQPTHFNPAGVPRRANPAGGPSDLIACPYGQPGDQLWVRETWRKVEPGECGCSEHCNHRTGYDYRATGSGDDETKWKPSIHMPRAASRIQLEITGLRVERLQDIREEDALAEGVTLTTCHPRHANDMGRRAYQALWESINGPGSWADNPWVWAIDFKPAFSAPER